MIENAPITRVRKRGAAVVPATQSTIVTTFCTA